jgi:hypothetical protein
MDGVSVVWAEWINGQDAHWIASPTEAIIMMPAWLRGTAHGEALLLDTLNALAALRAPQTAAV